MGENSATQDKNNVVWTWHKGTETLFEHDIIAH